MMRRIRDSLGKDDVHALFERAKNFNKKNVDNIMVLMGFQLAFYCAIKKGELLSLKVRDVLDDSGEVRDHIKLRGQEIPLPEDLKSDMKKYLDHLRAKRYPSGKNAYLFPIKKSAAYKTTSLAARERKWHRDVHEIADMYNAHEKIRQAGIREYFDQLPSNIRDEHRLKETAQFAGCSTKWGEIVLANRKR